MIYTLAEIKRIIEPIAKKYGVTEVYLFGSYARGEADEKSDLDLAIRLDKSCDQVKSYFKFLEELEEAFQKEVDLIFIDNVYESATCFENRFAPRFEREKITII